MQDSDLERIEIELALLVRRTTAIASGRSDGPLDRSGYLLLSAMREQGAVSVKTIAAELGLNVSTASRQLAALEKKGFAARRPDPSDGRASLFEATASGECEMAVYREKRIGRIARRIGGWSDADCGEFGRLLERFNRSFST